jgi:branched-chain amino acid transport system permease protein
MTAMAAKSAEWRISGLPRRGRISWFELILFAACVSWVALGLAPTLQDVVVLSFLFAGLALAWNIAGGCVGLISFGHAAFFGIGAYVSTILLQNYNVTPWLGIFAGAAAAAVAGAVLALICARLKGPFFILSSLAFAEVVRIHCAELVRRHRRRRGVVDPAGAELGEHGARFEDRL